MNHLTKKIVQLIPLGLIVDFALAVKNAGHGTFIYFDPPYHNRDKTNCTSYQPGGFNMEEHKRLRDVFLARTEEGAKCLLSNSDTPFVHELYNDSRFEIINLNVKHFINSKCSKRGDINELLIKNWR
jgi:DNA adenine methylase